MVDYQMIPISRDFHFEVNPKPENLELSDETNRIIETIWAGELQERPKTFNGKILSVESLEKNKCIGYFVDYKIYLAQMRQPQLYQELHLHPVAINGITMAGDYVLMGQRTKNVAHYPLFYELVPSGGLDPSS